ncbi:MAG: glycosyltransferase involved in cell wall biosynthesis [Parasphingorhabdus sp.]
MNIAFYAPLKSPDHPNPSGDRLLGRLLMQAMQLAGHHVFKASSLRSLDRSGEHCNQQRIKKIAEKLAHRFIRKVQRGVVTRPDIWFTYHIYHKAPDWIGPYVSEKLAIPYVIAEASVSPKQQNGSWSNGHQQAVTCIEHADAMVALNQRDIECARPYLAPTAKFLALPPYLDTQRFHLKQTAKGTTKPTSHIKILAVAMMRPGDKQQSWQFLSKVLATLKTHNWEFHSIGSGKCENEIVNSLQIAAGDKHFHHGAIQGQKLVDLVNQCDLFAWPAMNEALGMALLEAQACGLPVLAGRNGGVANVVQHGTTGLLCSTHSVEQFSNNLDYLLERPAVIGRMGRDARDWVIQNRRIESAANKLNQLVGTLCAKS